MNDSVVDSKELSDKVVTFPVFDDFFELKLENSNNSEPLAENNLNVDTCKNLNELV